MFCFQDLPYVWFIDLMIGEANRPGQWRCLSLDDIPPQAGVVFGKAVINTELAYTDRFRAHGWKLKSFQIAMQVR